MIALSISAVAFTDKGMELGRRLAHASAGDFRLSHCIEDELFSWTKANFNTGSALLFIGPVSVAVRALSPFLKDQARDPAAVVLDEFGNFSVPLVPGLGNKAAALAYALAKFTGGTAVMTNTEDFYCVFSVEPWAESVGLRIANPERVKQMYVKPLSGKTLRYKSVFPIAGSAPPELEECQSEEDCDFVITYLSSVPDSALHLVPPVLTLGIDSAGLDASSDLEKAVRLFMGDCSCHMLSLRGVCSESGSRGDEALARFCLKHGLPLSFLGGDEPSLQGKSAENCAQAERPCEHCAVFGSSGGTLLVRETIVDGIAMSLAISEPS